MYNFIHIPKAAGSSFYKLIEGYHDRVLYSLHTRAIDIHSLAFVRNPYDRLVSAYFYLINGGGKNELDLSYQQFLIPYKNFTEFVLSIEKDDLINKILHIKPMHYFLCNDEHKIAVEKIFKIEDINAIDLFLSEIGIEKKLSESIINTSEHEPYLQYMNPEVIAEINKIYSLDFELFNYEEL